MTPQDIREKTFEKAMFGGYDMAAVQNYQEEVATELANAQKEVAVLKGKMKVRVDTAPAKTPCVWPYCRPRRSASR